MPIGHAFIGETAYLVNVKERLRNERRHVRKSDVNWYSTRFPAMGTPLDARISAHSSGLRSDDIERVFVSAQEREPVDKIPRVTVAMRGGVVVHVIMCQ